nr:MAG TPA: hypothetical protein [Caudoviricetes sp.]
MVYYDIRYCYREKTLNVFARAVSVDIALIFCLIIGSYVINIL